LHSVGKGANRTRRIASLPTSPRPVRPDHPPRRLRLYPRYGSEAEEGAARSAGGRTARRKEGSRRWLSSQRPSRCAATSFPSVRFPARL